MVRGEVHFSLVEHFPSSLPVTLLLGGPRRKGRRLLGDSTSFLDLNVVRELVCERIVDLLLGFAQALHFLLPDWCKLQFKGMVKSQKQVQGVIRDEFFFLAEQ